MEEYIFEVVSTPEYTERFFFDRGFTGMAAPLVENHTVVFPYNSDDEKEAVERAKAVLELCSVPFKILGPRCWSCGVGDCTKHAKSV